MQNKAKVNIGKMNISIATIKDYDKNNGQSTTNVLKTKPNKAKVNIGKIGRRQKTVVRIQKFIRRRRDSLSGVAKAKTESLESGRKARRLKKSIFCMVKRHSRKKLKLSGKSQVKC
jgi:hypothetical protein